MAWSGGIMIRSVSFAPLTTKLPVGKFKPNDKIKVSVNGDKPAFQRR
jgi:hypothetical protein